MAKKRVIKPQEDTTKRDYRWWETDESKLVKLETAYRVGASNEEACSEADITVDQLYYYQKEVNPQFRVKKKAWKQMPTMIARHSVVGALKRNPDLAFRYLERRRKDEFSQRSELTGKDGKDLPTPILNGIHSDNGSQEATTTQ